MHPILKLHPATHTQHSTSSVIMHIPLSYYPILLYTKQHPRPHTVNAIKYPPPAQTEHSTDTEK